MYYLIAIAIAGFILNLPTVKGFFGEFFIRVILKFLDKEKYMVINDVLIPAKYTSKKNGAEAKESLTNLYESIQKEVEEHYTEFTKLGDYKEVLMSYTCKSLSTSTIVIL